ncbi:conserved hypothetical protein [Delftia phage PhiW-14]|uniref:Uncharacterized protein n=1 Tax=Delftia phage PhiW-14 TaxID=665032 RepID=C9DGF5_BPW14|nr:hypothetical protein DP-phiW-14_gp185 [Delftia phage PhiW-14]ACV50206.1 conserved hypothetical protein [Delftia phage PhiW-14]
MNMTKNEKWLMAKLEELKVENSKLRNLVSHVYAGLGAECDLPEKWLDALNDASLGRPFTTEGLLPFVSSQRHDAERYQYIRTGKHYTLKVGQDTIHCGGHSFSPKYGPALDKAIDEARGAPVVKAALDVEADELRGMGHDYFRG